MVQVVQAGARLARHAEPCGSPARLGVELVDDARGGVADVDRLGRGGQAANAPIGLGGFPEIRALPCGPSRTTLVAVAA